MRFFGRIFEHKPVEPPVEPDKDELGEPGPMEQKDDVEMTRPYTREEMEAMTHVGTPDKPQAPEGPVGMQHFGYDRVDGMDSRFPQGGGPDRQAEREQRENLIRQKQEQLTNSGVEDAARIRRIRDQINTVKRDNGRI